MKLQWGKKGRASLVTALRKGGAGAVEDETQRGRVSRRMRSYTTRTRNGETVVLFAPNGRRPREVPPPAKREEAFSNA